MEVKVTMMAPRSETFRAAELRRYHLDQGLYREELEGLIDLAQHVTQCPMVMVSILNDTHERAEAMYGLDDDLAIPLDRSLTVHALGESGFLEISDCAMDPRTLGADLVVQDPDPVRFYAGAQIVSRKGLILGAFCVMDHWPRQLDAPMRNCLHILADQAMRLFEVTAAFKTAAYIRADVAALKGEAEAPAPRDLPRRNTSKNPMLERLLADLHRDAKVEATLDVTAYLRRAIDGLSRSHLHDITVEVEFDAFHVPAFRAPSVGVLLNELVAKTVDRAVVHGHIGRIEFRGIKLGDMYRLDCLDDGAEGAFDPVPELPARLCAIAAAAEQLQGALRQGPRDDGGHGRQVTVILPLAA
ncbi:MAG: hypothetical protein AAFY65_05260 [Pseudomonadota bacterium]